MSILASDRVQLTQDQIATRWMGPDGPVILTKGLTVSALQKGDVFLHRALERKEDWLSSSPFQTDITEWGN